MLEQTMAVNGTFPKTRTITIAGRSRLAVCPRLRPGSHRKALQYEDPV